MKSCSQDGATIVHKCREACVYCALKNCHVYYVNNNVFLINKALKCGYNFVQVDPLLCDRSSNIDVSRFVRRGHKIDTEPITFNGQI